MSSVFASSGHARAVLVILLLLSIQGAEEIGVLGSSNAEANVHTAWSSGLHSSIEIGVKYFGAPLLGNSSEIRPVVVASPEECADACMAQLSCWAWSFTVAIKQCDRFRDVARHPERDQGVIGGRRRLGQR